MVPIKKLTIGLLVQCKLRCTCGTDDLVITGYPNNIQEGDFVYTRCFKCTKSVKAKTVNINLHPSPIHYTYANKEFKRFLTLQEEYDNFSPLL